MGELRGEEWMGGVIVTLFFIVRSDITRTEFKGKCNEVGLYEYCLGKGKVERGGEHSRATLKQSASQQ